MKWYKIKTEADIEYLHHIYNNFADSTLVSYRFESGNFVDENQVGHEFNRNKFYLFQRLNDNPFSIEIVFEYTKRFNFFAPVGTEDSWRSEIEFAKIVKKGRWFYWTTWGNFDPDNQEHFSYNDFILIQAQTIKWRVVEEYNIRRLLEPSGGNPGGTD